MWSGPRNISTAVLRAWGSRPDTFVTDEPLYAHYLLATGADHPGRDEIIAHHEADWRKVAAWLTGPVPDAKPVWYQKHMAHHLTPEIDTAWIDHLTNCFLIRDPAEMITSYIKIVPDPSPHDLGLPQQLALFERERTRTGRTPPVLDSRDVLEDPRTQLTRLCEAVGVPFDETMLSWPPGPRPTDGIWARHWYAGVEASTGFAPYAPKNETVPDHLATTLAACQDLYDQLAVHRL
jgi:hypothetical protein